MAKDISKRYAIYALIIIFLANFLSYLDRFLVSAVLPKIHDDFHLSGPKESFLWIAFTIGYMISAPFIGYLADRRSRPRIFAFCIFIWSLATIASGLSSMAGSYLLLSISRIVIGVGEAGCLIIGPTLISDYFAPQIRGKMLSVFFLALPLGSIGGFIIGGVVKDWQNAFYIGGIPGFLIALLILFLYEPERGQSEHTAHTATKIGGLKECVDLLKTKTLLFIIFAQAAGTAAFIPLIHFGKEYLRDVRKIAESQATIILGLSVLIGAFGNYLGGWLGDKLYKKNKGAYSFLAAICYIFGFAFTLFALLNRSEALYISGTLVAFFFFLACMPLVNTQIANVTSPNERAMAFSVAVFILHLLGDTISLYIFGYAKDAWGLQRSFLIFALPLILSSILCLLAAKHAKKESK